jgi:Zn-dependent M28 family amino/carboxypeptidase
MPRPPYALLCALVFAACTPAASGTTPADDPEVRALRDATLASSQAYDTVRALTDTAGPRLSGSPGNRLAIDWALGALREAGLSAVHGEAVTVPHWERGDEEGALLEPAPQRIALTALGGSVGTPPGGVEADVVEIASIEAADKLEPGAAAGKIVFFYSKMERTRDGSGYGKAVWPRSKGAGRAARLGAVGMVIRSVGTDHDRAPHTGGMHYEKDVPEVPGAALSTPDADLIHRLLAQGKRVRLRMKLGARKLPDAEGANVIGDVPGSAAPGDVVLLGAHLDSWDLGRGAIDDGAGCAIVIEAARQIARLPRHPRRTVRVVLFANEENGLAGADAYAEAHRRELDHHVVAMEAALGAGRVYETRYLGAESSFPLFQRVADAVEPLGVSRAPGEAEGGADLSPLCALGVPVVDLQQDATLYFDVHHTANDTLERVNKDEIDQAAAAFAAAAFAEADAAGDFGRVPEDARKRR